jgi:hypothetical protein
MLKPPFHLIAWKFVGIEFHNPIACGLSPGKRPKRLWLVHTWPFKKASTCRLHNCPHVFFVRPVVNDDQFIIASFGLLQKPLQQITVAVKGDNKAQGWHSYESSGTLLAFAMVGFGIFSSFRFLNEI